MGTSSEVEILEVSRFINFSSLATKGDKTMGSAGRREIEIEIGDKTYTVRELDLNAYGEIENFVKTKHARLYRESAVGVDPDRVDKAVMKIIKTSYTPEELGEEMSATDCVVFVAYQGMKHNPGMTFAAFIETLDMSDIGRIGEIIDAMGDDDEVNPPETEMESP